MAREDGNCEVWVGVEGLEDGRTEVPAGLGREWVSEGGLLCFAFIWIGERNWDGEDCSTGLTPMTMTFLMS